MDKQAFKQRMQNLKSYRENNPGKGYWDWKVQSFENGGEVIRKESTIGDKLDYDVMLQNQNTYQKEFATNWYKERAKNPKYRSQLGNGKLDKVLSDIDKATWKNPRDTSINNNMLKQLESSLRKTNDVKGDYFKLGTEQKAYMNQLRTRMYNDKAIDSLEEPVSTTLIKKYMDSLDDKDSIKRAYKQHKSLSAYTKWFNSIPLLGIGAIGVNKYFNNGTEQEK